MDAYYFQLEVHFISLQIIQNLETVKKLRGENQLYNMICMCNFTRPIAFPSSLIPATSKQTITTLTITLILELKVVILSISVTCWVAITNRRSFSFFLRLHSSHQLEKSLRYFFNSLKAELHDNMKVDAYVIHQN